jgi:beta-glucanase (GH16 family)
MSRWPINSRPLRASVRRPRRALRGCGLVLVLGLVAGWPALRSSAADAPPAPDWKLVWSDEFDGKDIDPTKWDFDLGNGFFNRSANAWIGGWGNNELQYYTRVPANVFLQDGLLHIRAQKEAYKGCAYTSARVISRKQDGRPLFNKQYGRFEFRAKLPTGRGLWPALWLLPQTEQYGGWAASGEIDVLEARGQEPGKVVGTLHYGARWPANAHSGQAYVLPDHGTIADFHIYALEWEPGEIRWFVDGHRYATQTFWWSSSKLERNQGRPPASAGELNPWPAPFDQPFYIIMNLAVGGNFLGNPDATTLFPAELVIDYVRVYDKVGGYATPQPRGPGKLPFAKP